MTRRAHKGFTLIEILMAMTILLVGCVSVYAVFAVGLVSHKRAIDNATAGVLASSLFDDIAANYDAFYYDRNFNGRPDMSEDRNDNGVDDWFELQSGVPRVPIPWRRGYTYTVRYERSDVVPQELFVTVQVFWQAQGQQRAETFRRSIYVRNLALYDTPPADRR